MNLGIGDIVHCRDNTYQTPILGTIVGTEQSALGTVYSVRTTHIKDWKGEPYVRRYVSTRVTPVVVDGCPSLAEQLMEEMYNSSAVKVEGKSYLLVSAEKLKGILMGKTE